MIALSVECDIDAVNIIAKLDDPAFWTFAAKTWHGLYKPFIPADTGRMANEAVYAPKTVTHTAPYAVFQYYGAKSGAKSALGSRAWDMAAAPSQSGALAGAMQTYIDGGGLGFGR